MNTTDYSSEFPSISSEGKSGKPVSVAVVGARGYSGLELCRLLLRHPSAKLATCFATDGDFKLSNYLGDAGAESVATLGASEIKFAAGDYDIVFLATPAEVSMDLAPSILEHGAHVVDLSGAYRLKAGSDVERAQRYQQWYGLKHSSVGLLDRAEFGLVPWAKGAVRGRGPRLIANPGCFSTSILMGVLPLLKAGLIRPESLVIDSKSGTTGAGRKAAEHLLFSEVEGECVPYRIGKHQHLPEIVDAIREFGEVECEPAFTPHLLNVRRGILSSIYAELSSPVSTNEVNQAFSEFYGDYPLVRYGALESGGGRWANPLVLMKSVVGSARCHIAFEAQGSRLYTFSVLDNLLKGAASQAVENLNRILGWPVETGLIQCEGIL